MRFSHAGGPFTFVVVARLCAPVLEIRGWASDCVSHVMLVPALLTRGSAMHRRPGAQGVRMNEPETHWANWPCTHASSPSDESNEIKLEPERQERIMRDGKIRTSTAGLWSESFKLLIQRLSSFSIR